MLAAAPVGATIRRVLARSLILTSLFLVGCQRSSADRQSRGGAAAPAISFASIQARADGAAPSSIGALIVDAGPADAPRALPSVIAALASDAASGVARVENAEGLVVSFFPDGRITVQGTDQWGGRIDTVYESPIYFRNALPALERSITAEQARALRRLAAH